MKRILSVLCALVLILLAGCAQSDAKQIKEISKSTGIPESFFTKKEAVLDEDNKVVFGATIIDSGPSGISVCTFNGSDPEREMAYIVAISYAFQKNNVSNYNISVSTDGQDGLFTGMDGEFSATFVFPESYEGVASVDVLKYASEIQDLYDQLKVDIDFKAMAQAMANIELHNISDE